MQLYGMETVLRHMLQKVSHVSIDEDTHAFCTLWQTGGQCCYVTTGMRPENETHEVDTEGINGANVVGFAHATNLNEHLRFYLILVLGLRPKA